MKMSKLKIAIFILIVVSIVFVGIEFYRGTFDSSNMEICRSLQAGISKEEIVHSLGAPISMYKIDENKTRYFFKTPSIAAEAMNAVVDERNGFVLSIECAEGG